jgi:hypothetical protein
MGCNSDTCFLIDNDTLCQYTPFGSGFDIKNYTDLVEKANLSLERVTADCDLCDGINTESYAFTDIIQSKKFKRYYAALIYYHWLGVYGSHQAHRHGLSKPSGDDFGEHMVATPREAQKAAENYRASFLSPYEVSFSEWFKAQESVKGCVECECANCGNTKSGCGCPSGFTPFYPGRADQDPKNLIPGQIYDPVSKRYVGGVDYEIDEDYSVI